MCCIYIYIYMHVDIDIEKMAEAQGRIFQRRVLMPL